jgi:hypothetical protein
MDSLEKKYTLTFYRKMANTNPEIMKRYKSAKINSMKFKQIIAIYNDCNVKFEDDVNRLLIFKKNELESTAKLQSNKIMEKYPFIKENSIIYTILTTPIKNSYFLSFTYDLIKLGYNHCYENKYKK